MIYSSNVTLLVTKVWYNNSRSRQDFTSYDTIQAPRVCPPLGETGQTGAFALWGSRQMNTRRSQRYRTHWGKLIEAHGSLCFYCQLEPAMCIDHIIPVSYGGSDDIDNLVPACFTCNLLASDKVFNDVWHKRQFILGRREKIHKYVNATCSDCLLPFQYRVHSPSLFLCAECYDAEYGTDNQTSPKWKRWLRLLETAGYHIDAHRQARGEIIDLDGGKNHQRSAYMILRKHIAEAGFYE